MRLKCDFIEIAIYEETDEVIKDCLIFLIH